MVNTAERKYVDIWSQMASKYENVGNYWEDVLDEISETIIHGGTQFETPLDLLPLIEQLPDEQMAAAWDAFTVLYPKLLWPDDDVHDDGGLVDPGISLREFCRVAWPIVEPKPFMPNWHIDCISEHLEACTYGQITRLLINIPPGHAKSLIVSVLFPAWQWLVQPRWRMLCASYAMDLAMRDAVRCRTLIESDFYKEAFGPKWELLRAQKAKRYYSNTKTGSRFSASVGSAITGFRGDALIFDDLMNAMDQYSPVKRREAQIWLDQAASNRLNDLRVGVMIMIAQRLHDGDPCGHVLRQGGWQHVCLMSRMELRRKFFTVLAELKADGTPKILNRDGQPYQYGTDIRTKEGESLFPTLFPEEVIERMERIMGPNAFAGQYQQNPAVGEGAMFKAGMFCRDELGESFWEFPRHLRIVEAILSMDNAVRDNETNDFTALSLSLMCSDGFLYLIPLVLARMQLPEVLKHLLVAWAEWKLGESADGSNQGIIALGEKLRYARLEEGAAGTAVEQQERLLRARANTTPSDMDKLIAAAALLKPENELTDREREARLRVDALNPPEGWTQREWDLYRKAGLIQLSLYSSAGKGKTAERATGIVPFCAGKNVRMVDMAGTCGARGWLGQLTILPNGEHDDAVQSTIGAVEPFIGLAVPKGRPTGGGDNLLALMRGETEDTPDSLMTANAESKRRDEVVASVVAAIQKGQTVVCEANDWSFIDPSIRLYASKAIEAKDVVQAGIALRELKRLQALFS